jgi:nucleoside-diphosphate-sugar epimerase
MKRVLITGLTGYIGTSLNAYLVKQGNKYQIDMLSVRDDVWKSKDFSVYDTTIHVAGIAHRKETPENAQSYYLINRDLAIEIAEKAKKDGCPHFVFMSSMSVYGMNTGVITKDTKPVPKSNYGKSKMQAEIKISELEDTAFRVCILRPPMVYGKGCKGNFQSVVKIVQKLPVFPVVNNKRSMIFIDNLCSFIQYCIDESLSGIYFPQNKEYANTTDMARIISNKLGKRVFFSRLCGLIILICRPFVSMLQKAFGSLTYENTEDFEYIYCVIDTKKSFEQSI